MVEVASQCFDCEHFDFTKTKEIGKLACAAFPDGIPAAVIDNVKDHRQPIEGDHGIRFEERSE